MVLPRSFAAIAVAVAAGACTHAHAPAAAATSPAEPASAREPPAMVVERTDARTPEPLDGGRVALGPFSMAVPASWSVQPVTSKMRVAQYVLSAVAGEQAELVIYYFGEGGAGTIDANVDRWLAQFSQPDGKLSRDVARIEHAQLAGQDATLVSVSGHYHAAAMPGGDALVDKADQALLAAIVASPAGPYFFKLVGAAKTVDANAASFRALLASLQLR